MLRPITLAAAALGPLIAVPAVACIPPPPVPGLPGETREQYIKRVGDPKVLARLQSDRLRQDGQTRLYDKASRVSVAFVRTSTAIDLPNWEYGGHGLELEPQWVLKGPAGDRRPRFIADSGMNTCGFYGGGTATQVEPGDYVILFEDVQSDGPTPHLATLIEELREPRLLAAYATVVPSRR